MRGALVIARRELAAYLYAPIAYVVGFAFVAIQGFSFAAIVKALADPREPAIYGAVLRHQLGASFLYWAVLFAVVAVLSMRLVAEEKRQGTWEVLLTTRASEAAVLLGKWLAASAFFAALWLPTLLYPVILAHYSPPGAGLDPGPIASAYGGVLASGCAFLALGLAVSAATSNQIIAGFVTFVLLLCLLLLGQLSEISPAWLGDRATLAALLDFVNLRQHMEDFARGVIAAAALVFYAALLAASLAAAHALAAAGRRVRAAVAARAATAVLVATIGALASILAARHPQRWDTAAARNNSLDPQTRHLLATVDEPIAMLLVRPGLERLEAVWAEVDRLASRITATQPLITRRTLDLALEPERIATLAREFALTVDDLKIGGGILLRRGASQRAISLMDVVDFAGGQARAGTLAAFRAEQAVASALAELIDSDRPTICATSGRGELPLDGEGAHGPHWGAIGERLVRDGAQIETIGHLAGGVPTWCRVVIVAGPERPLGADEALAVAEYLRRGGRLFLAVQSAPSSVSPGGELPETGLELVLAEYGVALPRAIALDPSPGHGLEMTHAWLTADGYGSHPAVDWFGRRRFTVWYRPRVVLVEEGRGDVLVHTSAAGWGETDLSSLGRGPVQGPGQASIAALGPRDLPGPVPVAIAVSAPHGARLVVVGSALSLSSEFSQRGLGQNDALAALAITWLSGRARLVPVGDKIPEQVHLVMTRGQIRAVFVLCAVAIPLAFAALGGFFWWWRRRG